MPKLTKKAIRYGRTDGRTYGRTHPNYRKASLLKIFVIDIMLNSYCFRPDFLAPELPAIAEFSTNETMGHSADRYFYVKLPVSISL